MASCTLVAESLTNSNFFDDYSDIMKFWSNIITTLMESDLEFSMHGLRLKDIIEKFVDMAPTARHLYKICDILNDEVSEYILVIHIYNLTSLFNKLLMQLYFKICKDY